MKDVKRFQHYIKSFDKFVSKVFTKIKRKRKFIKKEIFIQNISTNIQSTCIQIIIKMQEPIFRILVFSLSKNIIEALVYAADIEKLNLYDSVLDDLIVIKINNRLTYIPSIYKNTAYEKDNTYYLNQNLVIQIKKKVKDVNVDELFTLSLSSLLNKNRFIPKAYDITYYNILCPIACFTQRLCRR